MTEKLLDDQISDQVEEIFADLKEPVEVLLFTDQANCDYCADTRQLLQEVTELSDKLSLTVYDIVEHSDLAARYRVDKTPGFVLAGKDGDTIIDYGIRYFGIPAGHEFTTLIHDLLVVSGGICDTFLPMVSAGGAACASNGHGKPARGSRNGGGD
jgi:alkyl hydroperoxide reductase subunit AhpF